VINGNIFEAESGLVVTDIGEHPDFVSRPLRERDMVAQRQEMQRLVELFVAEPTTILQRLTDAAVSLCGADSAGISIEQPNRDDSKYWYWAATSGMYKQFQEATLARYPSACGTALDRGGPQHLVVRQEFFDLMGIQAPVVTDGLLLPWKAAGKRGTFWIMAHERTEAFDVNDLLMAGTLADFAAMATRQYENRTDETLNGPVLSTWARTVKEPIEISMKQMFLEASRKNPGSKPN